MIELACMRWLRFENRCVIVLNERTPNHGHGQPDVLGVTRARFMKEIEVKRSLSDFRANAKKHHVINREHFLHLWPKQFYFAVPRELADKVKAELPPYAGLLSVEGPIVHVIVVAPSNDQAQKLSVKKCVRLAECMSNQIACMSAAALNWGNRSSFCSNSLDCIYNDWLPDGANGYSNYQI